MPLWSVTLDLKTRPSLDRRQALEAVLEPFGEALSSFEAGAGWHIAVIGETKPAAAAMRAALKPFKLSATIAVVPDKDWVAESRSGLAPIAVGPFLIFGEHDRDSVKRRAGRIMLEIDAGAAFGTGRHETTSGCLKALLRLQKSGFKPKRILDLGTGTGILAFAAWHLWGDGTRNKPAILAADNDRDAVRVARENAALNGLAKNVRVVKSDGYKSAAIAKLRPCDLIVANILANPLIALAPGLERNLARSGRAVLSGLLREQEADVLAAHRAVGLTLDFRLRLGQWSVLVLRR